MEPGVGVDGGGGWGGRDLGCSIRRNLRAFEKWGREACGVDVAKVISLGEAARKSIVETI